MTFCLHTQCFHEHSGFARRNFFPCRSRAAILVVRAQGINMHSPKRQGTMAEKDRSLVCIATVRLYSSAHGQSVFPHSCTPSRVHLFGLMPSGRPKGVSRASTGVESARRQLWPLSPSNFNANALGKTYLRGKNLRKGPILGCFHIQNEENTSRPGAKSSKAPRKRRTGD